MDMTHASKVASFQLLTGGLVLQQMVGLFRDKCQGRLHWGKAGWPKFAACFDGATEYPDSWCDFGCAVQVGQHIFCHLLTLNTCLEVSRA